MGDERQKRKAKKEEMDLPTYRAETSIPLALASKGDAVTEYLSLLCVEGSMLGELRPMAFSSQSPSASKRPCC